MFKLTTDSAAKPDNGLSAEHILTEVTFWRASTGEVYQVIPHKLAPKAVFLVVLQDPKDPGMKIPALCTYHVSEAVYMLKNFGAVELDGELILKAK